MSAKLTSEQRSEVRRSATELLNEWLKGERKWSGYLTEQQSDMLTLFLGKEDADELRFALSSRVGDLFYTRDEMSTTMSRVVTACQEAEKFLHGEPGRFYSQGILRDNGVTVDVLAAKFTLQYELALDSVSDVFEQLELVKHGVENLDTQLSEMAAERTAAQKVRAAEAAEAKKARDERLATECQAQTQGSSWRSSGHKCSNKGRFLVTFEDGSQVRLCGNHFKSEFRYTPLFDQVTADPQLAVGSSFYSSGRRMKVTAVEDTRVTK